MDVSNVGCCQQCGHSDRTIRIYRDPFGAAIAPGRWPTISMHPDCFLAYVAERKSVGLRRER